MTEQVHDYRMYVPRADGWTAHVKQTSEKLYCYFQNPGEDYFHLLVSGEIYLQKGDEKMCLNCAMRHGSATDDRLFWQHHKRDSLPFV